MKKILKIFGIIIAVLIIGVAGLLTYVKVALPNVGPPPNLKVESTPERLERGYYLANSIAGCMDCHAERDWTKFAGPVKEGTLGSGGEIFDQKFGFPGRYTSKNITPYGIGNWTDGELFRAITSGVNKDGKALFPIMPHPNFGQLDSEDIYSIIAYIRTLKPIKKDIEPSSSDFPMNFIVNTIPQKPSFHKMPHPSDSINYGKYLFTMASCNDCHTKKVKGEPVKGMELAGGFEFPLSTGGTVRSANITPDMETGIGNLSKDAFVKKFKNYADSSYVPATITPGAFNTVMPWAFYGRMKTGDLEAIYTYLRTVKPIKNEVQKFSN